MDSKQSYRNSSPVRSTTIRTVCGYTINPDKTSSSQRVVAERDPREQLRLREAEKTIANKEVIIKMLKNQVKKMEESYMQNMQITEEFRYKYCQATDQLRKMRSAPKIRECIAPSCFEMERKAIKEDFSKWKEECEGLLNQRCPDLNKPQSTDRTKDIFQEHFSKLSNLVDKPSSPTTESKTDRPKPEYDLERLRQIKQEVEKLQADLQSTKEGQNLTEQPTKETSSCSKNCQDTQSQTEPPVIDSITVQTNQVELDSKETSAAETFKISEETTTEIRLIKDKVSDLTNQEESTAKEVEGLKTQLGRCKDQTGECCAELSSISQRVQEDRELCRSKFNQTQTVLSALKLDNKTVKLELEELKVRVDSIQKQLASYASGTPESKDGKVKLKVKETVEADYCPKIPSESDLAESDDVVTMDECKYIIETRQTTTTSSLTQTGRLIRQNSSCEALKGHYCDLEREKSEKDQQINWLKDLISFYTQLNAEIEDLNITDTNQTPDVTTTYECACGPETKTMDYYIQKVMQENEKLRAKISVVMLNLKEKMGSNEDSQIKDKAIGSSEPNNEESIDCLCDVCSRTTTKGTSNTSMAAAPKSADKSCVSSLRSEGSNTSFCSECCSCSTPSAKLSEPEADLATDVIKKCASICGRSPDDSTSCSGTCALNQKSMGSGTSKTDLPESLRKTQVDDCGSTPCSCSAFDVSKESLTVDQSNSCDVGNDPLQNCANTPVLDVKSSSTTTTETSKPSKIPVRQKSPTLLQDEVEPSDMISEHDLELPPCICKPECPLDSNVQSSSYKVQGGVKAQPENNAPAVMRPSRLGMNCPSLPGIPEQEEKSEGTPKCTQTPPQVESIANVSSQQTETQDLPTTCCQSKNFEDAYKSVLCSRSIGMGVKSDTSSPCSCGSSKFSFTCGCKDECCCESTSCAESLNNDFGEEGNKINSVCLGAIGKTFPESVQISNLETYVKYLQTQLEVISTIEVEIDGLKNDIKDKSK